MKKLLAGVVLVLAGSTCVQAEDGYECWLRYRPVADPALLERYRELASEIVVVGDSPVLDAAGRELYQGLSHMLNQRVSLVKQIAHNGTVVVGSLDSSLDAMAHNRSSVDALNAAQLVSAIGDGGTFGKEKLGPEGFTIRSTITFGRHVIAIFGQTDRGALYGTFHLLRLIQTRQPIGKLDIENRPDCPLRVVNHWDNPGDTGERGYAGMPIFHWEKLPELEPRYRDYGRLLASVGVNGCVVNNVNTAKNNLTGWKLITTPYLDKAAALADVFRDYGVKMYISVNFASPMLIDGFDTADPLDPKVQQWWKDKADEIYAHIPDFGGFLVKADSEGEPGPFTYGRNHAEGANMLAAALEPHGGLVMWRAFVYGHKDIDRAMQAFANFKPLDGRFADNVIIQIKNGPMDFQVREPVSPLFGRMPATNLMIELQITQEYTGHSTHLCYLVPQWKYFLEFDTRAEGPGSTLDKVVDGSLHGYAHSGMAGVANIGSDRNWTGHHLAQANMYGYGRLAWDPDISSETITDEWVRMTFGHDPEVVDTISRMLLDSWRTYENYTSPLGVGFMCNRGSHYDPDPAGRQAKYHHADEEGVGYDRTQATGSGYTAQYHAPVARMFESLETCPDELLLFFHHVPYTHRLKSGKTVIQHIYDSHFDGVAQARGFRAAWKSLEGKIDYERYVHVLDRLDQQIEHATLWRDTINDYFLELSGIADEQGRLKVVK